MQIDKKLAKLENNNEHSLYCYEVAKFVGEKQLANRFLLLNKINIKHGHMPYRLLMWRDNKMQQLAKKHPIIAKSNW